MAVDVNSRALELVRRNAERAGVKNLTAVPPDEVPAVIKFAAIWSNPPVRIGKPALQELVSTWLQRLIADGDAWLVIKRDLGGASLYSWMLAQYWSVERAGVADDFQVCIV